MRSPASEVVVATAYRHRVTFALLPSGNRTMSVSLTGATGTGAKTEPWLSVIAMTFSPFWRLYPENPIPSSFSHGIGPVAMQHAEIELLLGREMPHTGHKRLLK